MADACGGDITQKCPRIAGIENCGEGGPFGEASDQPIVEHLEERVSMLML